ncbi:uncharacterized protein KNAG_0A02300, partial [Huiozyma naganishii CBS 8797]
MDGKRSATDPATQDTRKKRKHIRTCTFCRQRKVRCDQGRPLCSSCKARGFSECIYLEDADITNEDYELSLSIIPRINISQQISSLQKELETLNRKLCNETTIEEFMSEASPNDRTTTDVEKPTNPLYDFVHLQVKESGRRIMYGPTSVRSYIVMDKWGFGAKAYQLLSKVKLERRKWKLKNKPVTTLRELGTIEDEYDVTFKNLISEVCHDLPTIEKCHEILQTFFNTDNDELYHMNRILDPNKVIKDFFASFVPRTFIGKMDGPEKRFDLVPGPKKNYYKLGVILMIICIVHYEATIPNSVHHLLVRLTGMATAKVFHVERVQFLVMRCEYIKLHCPNGDDTHLLNLISLAASNAVVLGLNRDIHQLYKDQESVVGTLDSLENLWYAILLADAECSFQMGKPLYVPKTFINVCSYEEERIDVTRDKYRAYKSRLQRFLKLIRPMLLNITEMNGRPNLKIYTTTLLSFLEKELMPVAYFTSDTMINTLYMRDIRLFIFILQMCLCFVSLRFAVFGERSKELKQLCIQISLVLFKCDNVLLHRCFALDKKWHKKYFENISAQKGIPPYMSLHCYITMGLAIRVTSVFCPMLYHKFTRFDGGLLFQDGDVATDWDYTYIVKPPGSKEQGNYTLLAYQVYCQLLSLVSDPEDPELKAVLKKSQFLHIVLALEKVYRTVIKKALEFRQMSESIWRENNDQEMDLATGSPITATIPVAVPATSPPFGGPAVD